MGTPLWFVRSGVLVLLVLFSSCFDVWLCFRHAYLRVCWCLVLLVLGVLLGRVDCGVVLCERVVCFESGV